MKKYILKKNPTKMYAKLLDMQRANGVSEVQISKFFVSKIVNISYPSV